MPLMKKYIDAKIIVYEIYTEKKASYFIFFTAYSPRAEVKIKRIPIKSNNKIIIFPTVFYYYYYL